MKISTFDWTEVNYESCAISVILSYCNKISVGLRGAFGQADFLVGLATKMNFCSTEILFYVIRDGT